MNSLLKISCVILILVAAAVEKLEAGGNLEWTILKYVNPGGKISNGQICEWYGPCDHVFTFGLDDVNGDDNPLTTPLLTKKTSAFNNEDTNTFTSGADNHGVFNPIIYPFTFWKGGIRLKVSVVDDDSVFGFSPDYVDGLVYKLVAKPSASYLSAVSVSTVMGIRTKLYFTYRVYCDANYYGDDCAKNCVGHDDSLNGHYSCDSFGNKVCLKGWENEGNNCKDRQNDCETNNCQNGALCIDGIRSYTCQCKPGYTDKYCDTNINECLSGPCQNGGACIDGVNDYTCMCQQPYVGKNCAKTACTVSSPCKNGGSCYGDSKCLCPSNFVGDFCEIPLCNKTGCLNGGKCSLDGSCMCPPGVRGFTCDVVLCDFTGGFCLNGGICTNGRCECPNEFAGATCGENIVCKYTRCQNEGQCRSVVTNTSTSYEPKCFCPSGFSGAYCEIVPQLDVVKYNNTLSYVSVPDELNKRPFTPLEILFIFFIVMTFVLFIICIVLSVLLCKARKSLSRNNKKKVLKSVTSVTSDCSSTSDVFSEPGRSTVNSSTTSSHNDTFKTSENFSISNTVTSSVLPNIYSSTLEDRAQVNKIFDDCTYSRLNDEEIGFGECLKKGVVENEVNSDSAQILDA
ncbi:hypothetical protein HELRODRAFT_109730 [Helobdella robusta]|uniref:Uncharacterized protein n=1 Tax=Helobdella robusta TaxID=6412 RepID=T1EEW1_HELRO|nr:hypothetical protein HELRODRAFT_109730 [Helobdella robusta]ESO09537.1 hypothetical protein HELRODRAFT_109730 [Helobdella robusta]